jgi:dephospho-CoA kinase
MLRVGLTGGIASGKSVVGEMFVQLGAELIEADRIAHELMQPGQAVYAEVVRKFGLEILDPDGTVNRPRLAEAAFGRPGDKTKSRIQELNSIVHPAVLTRQERWMDEVGAQNPNAIAIVEAALLLEAGARKQFKRIVVVTCKNEQRVERVAARLKIDLEKARGEVARRMAAQWPDEKKIAAADYMIDNSGSLDATQAQVREIFRKLKAEVNSPQ